MNPTYAYAHGALVKMAEHNVSPRAFVQAAINTQDPVALKVANAIAEYEKVAGRAADILSAGGDMLASAGNRAQQFGSNLMTGREGRRTAKNLIGTVDEVMGGNTHLMDDQARAVLEDRLRRVRDQNLAMGGALGLGGLGAAGVYGAGDADTMQNQAAQLANQYLGTDLGTQSRAGAGLEALQGMF